MTVLFRIVSSLVLFFAASLVHAAITVVNTSPSSANVPVSRSVSISLVWLANSNTAGQVAVTSTQAEFRTPGGQVLRSSSKKLGKTIAGPGVANIQESVLVPTSLVQRSLKLGFNRILYRRSFNDGGGAASTDMVFYFTSTGAASFAISGIALRFDNKEATQIIEQGKKHYAYADISVVGSGLIKGFWEVARPNAINKKGEPIFVPVKQVTRYIKSSSRPLRIKSPTLPADIFGQYQLRFRIQKPGTGFQTPIIHYSVTTGNK
ncbi:MAG: hypothetical protein BMS9Abin11_1427 [Gammaproteobacteria bacterium]|nr:MAG: hypothetical protein BMS9Abin11_1427 [Gammaproteobacteria bacterium]